MKPSQNTRILKLLSDGEWHDHHQLYSIGCVAHSRIAELRKHGYVIEKRQFTVYGKQVWEYRLVGEVEEPATEGGGTSCESPAGSDKAQIAEAESPRTSKPGRIVVGAGSSTSSHLHTDTIEQLV